MRRNRSTIIAGLWSLLVLAGITSPAGQVQSLGDVWLEGTVGQAAVRIFIGDAGFPKTEGLWGMYYYTKYWIPIPLEGDWLAPDRIRLFEGSPGEAGAKPRFEVALRGGQSVVGTWISADERQTLRVALRRVRKPARFGEAELARRFVDANWPITFAYPSDWRLDVGNNLLTLRSPDPEEMMFGNQLSCTRGHGLPSVPGPDEAPVLFEWPFFRGRTGWLAESGLLGGCDTEPLEYCEAPKSRPAGRATFMSADVGYRAHGPWGYSGIGEASMYLVVTGDQWVHCRDRALDSDTRIGVHDAGRHE